MVEHDSCEAKLRNTRLGESFGLDYSFNCAGGEAGIDLCTGDGGGPLVCASKSNPNSYYQVSKGGLISELIWLWLVWLPNHYSEP